MPFTLAHTAAALPFRRLRLVPSALVVGTVAPDCEYFLRLAPLGGFGHTLPGAFLLSLPLALLVLWMFHSIVKAPLVRLFPEALRQRLTAPMGRFRFGGIGRLVLIALSALIGIATHILWDSFTHDHQWPTRHWTLLRQTVHVPVLGEIPFYRILQHSSTIVGMALLCAWFIRWYRATAPRADREEPPMSSLRKWITGSSIAGAAIVAGTLRTMMAAADPGLDHGREALVGEGVITAIALAWWLLVAYAIVASLRPSSRVQA
jgi:hypothetical protein